MMGRNTLVNKKDEGLILSDLKIASTFLGRLMGLMGKELEEGQGLQIVPCNSIHCFFMKIPIDVLFLDENLRVIHKIEDMKPWRISPIVKGAKSCIEAGSGTFKNINPGDELIIKTKEDN